MNIVNVEGKKFGKLTAIERIANIGYSSYLCLCDCGNTKTVRYGNLVNGHCQSCGCLRKKPKKHGLSHSKIYTSYKNMIGRCYNINNKSYKDYGGRGIIVCDEWNSNVIGKNTAFKNFVEWSYKNGFRHDFVLDRIDNNGNYEPNNCRWITIEDSNRNRRMVKFYTYKGETKTIRQWGNDAICKVNASGFQRRLNRGWDFEKALLTPSLNTKC